MTCLDEAFFADDSEFALPEPELEPEQKQPAEPKLDATLEQVG